MPKEHTACRNICTQLRNRRHNRPTDKIRCYSVLTSKADTSNFFDLLKITATARGAPRHAQRSFSGLYGAYVAGMRRKVYGMYGFPDLTYGIWLPCRVCMYGVYFSTHACRTSWNGDAMCISMTSKVSAASSIPSLHTS